MASHRWAVDRNRGRVLEQIEAKMNLNNECPSETMKKSLKTRFPVIRFMAELPVKQILPVVQPFAYILNT